MSPTLSSRAGTWALAWALSSPSSLAVSWMSSLGERNDWRLGSSGEYPTRSRARTWSPRGSRSISLTTPEVGLMSPRSILMVVDLPEPLGPRNPTMSP